MGTGTAGRRGDGFCGAATAVASRAAAIFREITIFTVRDNSMGSVGYLEVQNCP